MDVDSFNIAFIVIQAVLIPVITLSNILVIAASLHWRKLRQPDDILMMNMAVADLLFGCISMPLTILGRLEDTAHLVKADKISCGLYITGLRLPELISVYSLAAFSFEKFVLMRFPWFYNRVMEEKKTCWAIPIIWITGIVTFSVLWFIFEFDTDVVDLEQRCYYENNLPDWWVDAEEVGEGIAIGVTAVTAAYFAYRVCTSATYKTPYVMNKTISEFERQHRIKLGMTALLLAIHSLLWLPDLVVNAIQESPYKVKDDIGIIVLFYIQWLPLCILAAVNMPVYAYCREDCRHAYYFLLHTCPGKWHTLGEVMAHEEYLKHQQQCFEAMGEIEGCNEDDAKHKTFAFAMDLQRPSYAVTTDMTDQYYKDELREMNKNKRKIHKLKQMKHAKFTKEDKDVLREFVFSKNSKK